MTLALGLLLLLAGAASAALLLLSGQLTYLPLATQAVYLTPSACLALTGIGLLRRHRGAYEAAKGFGIGVIGGLAGIAGGSGLITLLGTRPMLPLTPFASATAGALAIAFGLRDYARRTALAERFWREWRFPPRQAIVGLGLVAGMLSVSLWKDAATARDVAAALEPYTLHRVAAAEQAPAGRSTAPPPAVAAPVPRDPSLPPDVPVKVETVGDSVVRMRSGEVFWLDFTNRSANFGTNSGQFWNPATGTVRTVNLPATIPALTPVVAMPQGLLFAGGQTGERDAYLAGQKPPEPRAEDGLVLITPENTAVTGRLNVARAKAQLLALSGNQVLVAGGTVAWGPAQAYGRRDETRTTAVERVTIGSGEITSEKLPDLPGGVTRGYALVALDGERVMLLGGTASPFVGCGNCSAATYILDLKTGTWHPGPRMTEARAYAGVALLPDGSVLVAGGWTQKQDWQQGPARTTERWDPRTNAFAPGPPLASGAAGLRPLWAPGQEGRQLLLGGGTGGAVQVYDVASRTVRIAGDFWNPQESFGQVAVDYRGGSYLWLLGGARPFLVKLRLPDALGTPGPAADFDHKLYRPGIAFLPGKEGAPALALGGAVVSKQPTYYASAAVDAIWPDGRVQSLAPLNTPRSGARAFRLPDGGVLIMGGEAGRAAPAEWMPATADPRRAKWVTLDAAIPDEVPGQLADGSLVWADASGNITHIAPADVASGKPVATADAFPSLELHGEFRLKGLADGRIIAVGGARATEYVALLPQPPGKDGAGDNGNEGGGDSEDSYVPMGEESPVNYYQIYDPHTRAWRHSAPLDGYDDDQVAILDDGRVVSYGKAGMKISRADGTAWDDQPNSGRLDCLGAQDAKLFALEGELFLSGCDNGHTSAVQWFDFAGSHWTTIWQRPPNDDPTGYDWVYAAGGRVISRELPNGKRVVMPIQGP